jgi:hypothetical protein
MWRESNIQFGPCTHYQPTVTLQDVAPTPWYAQVGNVIENVNAWIFTQASDACRIYEGLCLINPLTCLAPGFVAALGTCDIVNVAESIVMFLLHQLPLHRLILASCDLSSLLSTTTQTYFL